MKYHTLIVEDEVTLLRGLMRGLEAVPTLHLTGCHNFEEGLKVLTNEPPDLLLTDLNLPDRSGLDFMVELDRLNLHIPVVIMTAYRAAFVDQLAHHPGLTVLEKPIALQNLRAVIEEKLAFYRTAKPIGPFQLADYLQISGFGKHSLTMYVELEGGLRGQIDIVNGDIWNVYLHDLIGREALSKCLNTPIINIGYKNSSEEPATRQLTQSWENLLLDLARIQDEDSLSFSEWHSREDLAAMSSSFTTLPGLAEFSPQTELTSKSDSLAKLPGIAKGSPQEYIHIANSAASSLQSSHTLSQQKRYENDEIEQDLSEILEAQSQYLRSPENQGKTEMAEQPRTQPPLLTKEHPLMANLNQVCQEVVSDVQDALACGVVDLNSGMLMGVHHTIPYFTQSYLDAVAAAAVDMFRGKNVRRVEQLLGKHRGTAVADSFQEVFISSTNTYHFKKIIPGKSAVVVLVTKKTTNQGMGWASLRNSLDEITAALP